MTLQRTIARNEVEEILHPSGEVDAQHRLPEGDPATDTTVAQPRTGEALFARIAERAYDLWLAGGCRTDSQTHDWLLAEQQVLTQLSTED